MLAALLLGFWGSATGPATAACNDFYRVRNGDTLQLIARRQLGNDDFAAIFRANGDILRDPSLIEVGQLLYLPCADSFQSRRAALTGAGIVPTSRDDLGDRLAEIKGPPPADARAPAADDSVAPLPPVADDSGAPLPPVADASGKPYPVLADGPGVKILTAAGMAPLVDRGLPSDGMALVIVSEALAASGDSRPLQPAFVDDRRSHLSELMPTGDFPLALPWPRPDCGAPDLSEESRSVCRDYLFSEPFYEIPVTLLVPPDSPLAGERSPSALAGRTICRPAGFPPFDLEQMEVRFRIVGAATPGDCALMVARGEADAVSLPDAWTHPLLAPQDAAGRLARARYLVQSVPVHAVAWRDAPGAAELIGRFDAGLQRILSSGRWVAVIQDYLRRIDRLPVSQ